MMLVLSYKMEFSQHVTNVTQLVRPRLVRFSFWLRNNTRGWLLCETLFSRQCFVPESSEIVQPINRLEAS